MPTSLVSVGSIDRCSTLSRGYKPSRPPGSVRFLFPSYIFLLQSLPLPYYCSSVYLSPPCLTTSTIKAQASATATAKVPGPGDCKVTQAPFHLHPRGFRRRTALIVELVFCLL